MMKFLQHVCPAQAVCFVIQVGHAVAGDVFNSTMSAMLLSPIEPSGAGSSQGAKFPQARLAVLSAIYPGMACHPAYSDRLSKNGADARLSTLQRMKGHVSAC